MRWRQNPQRVAWLVMTASFLTCCLLAISVPVGIRSFVLHASRPKPIFLTATAGTAQLQARGASDRMAVTDRRPVPEGSRIATDGTTKALLSFYADDGAQQELGTVQLFQETTVSVLQARSPRFNLSRDAHQLALDLERGRLVVSTRLGDDRPIQVKLSTPHANISFEDGTFDIAADKGETTVRVRLGTANVLAAGTQVSAGSGERITVPSGRPPSLPVPDALNLVLNGTFEGRLKPIWQESVKVGEGLAPGEVKQEQVGGRQVVRLTRRTEDGAPNEVGIYQAVNRDVQGYDSLVLRLDLQILHQSVPGGGERASEYPVMVRIDYTDIYGKDQFWVRGFYFLDLPPGSKWESPDTRGEKVLAGIWYTYESPNLFQLLSDTRPARINSIAIYAQGHDYDSRVTDVALIVR